MKYRWIRTEDHMAAGGREPQPGEQSWNIAFIDDEGRRWTIHVGPKSREQFLAALSAGAALQWQKPEGGKR